jgi:hypothetical protein
LHTVHVRVNDAATGQPTPCRVRFVDSRRNYLAPFGRSTNFPSHPCTDGEGNVELGRKKYCHIDGSCEINLPADPVSVEIHKGPEYTPLNRQVVLGPGKLALRLALERWIDCRADRWYSGDIHANYLPPFAALLEGAAEDLAVVNLLALEEDEDDSFEDESEEDMDAPLEDLLTIVSNITAFSGQRPALEIPGHMVVVGTQNWHPHLGSLGLLNSHRAVYPLRFGAPPEEWNDWSLAAWCDQCHRKGGLVVWSDFQFLLCDLDPEWPCGGEALADLILGKVDAIEFDSLGWEESLGREEWYRLLNCGLKVPLVGGSAKQSNLDALGSVRTYARLNEGEDFSYKNWIEAVRAGRTFVTNSPLLTFTVNGQDPGSTITLDRAGQMVRVRAEARSAVPMDYLEIIRDGECVARKAAAGSLPSAVIETELEIPRSGWLAARCGGTHELFTSDVRQTVSAHTSPIYVHVAGQMPRPTEADVAPILRLLEASLQWVQSDARFQKEKNREALAAIFQSAANVLAKKVRG